MGSPAPGFLGPHMRSFEESETQKRGQEAHALFWHPMCRKRETKPWTERRFSSPHPGSFFMNYDSLHLSAMDVREALRELRAGAHSGPATLLTSIDAAIVSIPAAILAADLASGPAAATTDLSRAVETLAQTLAAVDHLELMGGASKGPVDRARVAITELAMATMEWKIELMLSAPIQGQA